MTYKRPGVYINERLLPAPITTTSVSNAAGAVVAEFAQGPTTVTLVTSWYDFVKQFGGYSTAYPATFGVGQFFANGGSELYVKRVLADDADFALVSIPDSGEGDDVATITAKNPGSDGTNLRVQVSAAVISGRYDITVYREQVSGTASDVTNDIILERYLNVIFSDFTSTDYIETIVNQSSSYITVDVGNAAGTATAGVYPLVPPTGTTVTELNGTTPDADDYTAAITGLSTVTRPLLVFSPGLNERITANSATTVYNAWITWAAANQGFVIAETDAAKSVTDALTYAGGLTDSSHAAVYYPHFFISDPLGRSPQSLRKVGPSGAVAGVYLQTDRNYGPHKAPAGVRTSVVGAVALERAFTNAELDSLNSNASPLNALRNLPGAGIVVMGARTLKQDGTANRYVNMRRSLIYIRSVITDLSQFALFENNDERLWARLRTGITVFLNEYRNQGGLRGNTEAEAFYVKCDAENNTQSSIELGEVNIEVGVALQYPAEFVVITLSQKTAA